MIGVVISGTGKATEWQLENAAEVREKLAPLGWDDYAVGTLNVEVSKACADSVTEYPTPCSIGGVPCAIVKEYVGPVLEIMSPAHLRTVLGLVNGDEVEIETGETP